MDQRLRELTPCDQKQRGLEVSRNLGLILLRGYAQLIRTSKFAKFRYTDGLNEKHGI